jgi:hypothetical protein
MRRPKAILLAAVLTGVLSSGCTRIHSADELTQDTRPETTPVFTDTPELNFSADGVDPYANVIQYYAEQYQKDKENDDTLLPFTYVLYDMDKDGTPELIVRTGYSEADYALYVWQTSSRSRWTVRETVRTPRSTAQKTRSAFSSTAVTWTRSTSHSTISPRATT